MNKLTDAIVFALRAHDGQIDKAGEPYILHPLHVMLAVQQHDENTRIVAVLHDVVEDTGVIIETIARLFGEKVAYSVDILTRRRYETYEDYVQRIVDSNDKNALLIKRADLQHNMDITRIRNLNNVDMQRLTKYADALFKIEFYCGRDL